MKQFKDFGIQQTHEGFVGDKIKIDKILNRPIVVYKFKEEDSTKKPGTKYLQLQLSIGDTKHVLFTGSKSLMQTIKKVPAADFPFETTIIKPNDFYEFS